MKERMPVIKQKRAIDDLECSPNPHTTHEVSHDAIEPPPPLEPPAEKARYKKPERRINIVQDTREHQQHNSLPPSDLRGSVKQAVADNTR